MIEGPRFSKHCPKCDGETVYQVTFWRWDNTSQDWESADDDLIHCSECGWKGYEVETKLIWENDDE